MDPNPLRDHLKQLHEELSAATRVDPRNHELLGEIMTDIKRLMGPGPARQSADDAALTSLPDRLELLAVQFEVDHPTLAASSRRLVDLLGKVGL